MSVPISGSVHVMIVSSAAQPGTQAGRHKQAGWGAISDAARAGIPREAPMVQIRPRSCRCPAHRPAAAARLRCWPRLLPAPLPPAPSAGLTPLPLVLVLFGDAVDEQRARPFSLPHHHQAHAAVALQGNSSVGLVVMGEGEGARPLLIHRISKENQYQRQGGEPGRRGWRQRGWQQPRPAAETSSSSRAMRWAAAAPGADLHHRCFPGDAGAGGVADRAPPCLLVPACLRAWLCRR